MKEYILKRGKIIHLLSLVLIAISVFVGAEQEILKVALLIIGILGLITVHYFKENKLPFYLFLGLLIFAVTFYILRFNEVVRI